MNNQITIVIIGAGKLATNLAIALYNSGQKIVQVFSQDLNNAKVLAAQTEGIAIDDLSLMYNDVDLYIISVPDKAIGSILKQADFSEKRVVHTAGSVSLNIFDPLIKNCGVFYPFQTFSKERLLDFKNIPVCIEANNENFETFLNNIASQLSNNILNINSEDRKTIHLSGVFANNFVNYIYSLAKNILEEKGISFEILGELIKETAFKAIDMGPDNSQTGPAIRNDKETQKKHLDLLSSKPEIRQFYKWISEGIEMKYK